MSAATTKIYSTPKSPVQRVLGDSAVVASASVIPINDQIRATKYEVITEGPEEDRGMLCCFPISDDALSLLVLYAIATGGSGAAIFAVEYLPEYFTQFPREALLANQPFRFNRLSETLFPLCARSHELLNTLENPGSGTDLTRMLRKLQAASGLLIRTLECITLPFESCQVPACRFLGENADREKIEVAIRAIHDNINSPLTIKELAKKAAINECYLKKGFKTVTGKTIHEYQQDIRIATARIMLSEERKSVTEVAAELGYSSISHFSTAFKRVTGLKPCELLA